MERALGGLLLNFCVLAQTPNDVTGFPSLMDQYKTGWLYWMDFYGDGTKELPPDMPEPLGEAVKVTAFIDSDHAGNLVT